MSGWLLAANAILVIIIFLIAISTPFGVAVSVLYFIPVLVCRWIVKKQYAFIFAAVTSLLTLINLWVPHPGGYYWIAVYNIPLALTGIWTSLFFVIRFKLTEERGRTSNKRMDALFNYSTEGIIITNKNGEIVLINPSAEQMFGYAPGELVNKKIEVLIPMRYTHKHVADRDNYNAHPKARAMGTGRDLYALRKDGSEFPVEISLSYFMLEGEQYVISFIIDITTRKEAEDLILQAKINLEAYAEQLKASNKELEQFAYVASHDLQEPLRKIQAFGDRIRSKEGNVLSESGRDYLDRMLNAAGRMKNLINALLTFSRVSTQAKPFVNVDLNRTIRDVISDLEIAIETSSAKVNTEQLPTIEADPLQMWQLFQNLLSNALKFHKDDVSPVVNISCERIRKGETDSRRDTIKITVADNGIGFDQKYADRIFNIFQRLEGTNYEGTGVGLAICKKIAQRHSGDITAQSVPGEGSRFIITLPVAQGPRR
jgi:two-component system sensor kinase FixL